MRVLVLGADGYLGWPTCMYFSEKGWDVAGIDNYFRRNAGITMGCESLVPAPDLAKRAGFWENVSGKKIEAYAGDITDYSFLKSLIKDFKPDTIVHYAEQPSAPYSMIDRDKAAFTLQNNLLGTLNLAYAVRETDPACHIIKLGTMGEYGTPNIDIEEGWLDLEHKGRHEKFLFPRQASSLYHTTKIQDTDMLWFYIRTWGLSVTDLMQGPVYGISTGESDGNENLLPIFHYDEVFGTVLNRFIVQAVSDYPLTVYGKGNQTRGYLNIKDTLQCVFLSAIQPAAPGELRIFNQITEVFSVNQLASLVAETGKKMGYGVEIRNLPNPRKEKEEHYYNPKYTGLKELGLEPHLLSEEVLGGIFQMVERFKGRINRDSIFRGINWC